MGEHAKRDKLKRRLDRFHKNFEEGYYDLIQASKKIYAVCEKDINRFWA
jgi:hypothetical protein